MAATPLLPWGLFQQWCRSHSLLGSSLWARAHATSQPLAGCGAHSSVRPEGVVGSHASQTTRGGDWHPCRSHRIVCHSLLWKQPRTHRSGLAFMGMPFAVLRCPCPVAVFPVPLPVRPEERKYQFPRPLLCDPEPRQGIAGLAAMEP